MKCDETESQLKEWFEKLEKPLMNYAFQIVHDREEAQDFSTGHFFAFF